jgi:hypothetical protein
MRKFISTQPPRGANGKYLFGKAAEKARRERYRPRQKCRVCKGTKTFKDKVGSVEFDKECRFCDEDGYARFQCDDCGEALPMCKCVRNSGYAAAVSS